jgi:hypothetical protein
MTKDKRNQFTSNPAVSDKATIDYWDKLDSAQRHWLGVALDQWAGGYYRRNDPTPLATRRADYRAKQKANRDAWPRSTLGIQLPDTEPDEPRDLTPSPAYLSSARYRTALARYRAALDRSAGRLRGGLVAAQHMMAMAQAQTDCELEPVGPDWN